MKMLINKIFIDKTSNGVIQFIRYFFVGGIASVVNIGLLYILVDLIDINYIISNIVSFLFGLFINYGLSKKFVFINDNSMSKMFEIFMYMVIGVLGLVIDTFVLWIFTSKLKIYYMLSKIISTFMIFIWNFLARKLLYRIFSR